MIFAVLSWNADIIHAKSSFTRPKIIQIIDESRLSDLKKFNAPGAFGKVISATMDSIEPVMLKSSGDTMELSEFMILSSFNHPNIVQIYGTAVLEGVEYFVMNRCPHSL